ncbi:hypothetical protein GCM10023331_34910 [Algivirga pacifica]|uniref:Outer membrane protein beta-barrel domain-containing protein n=2 Tax=Algivirga pacifica TaxID=1162670 RepID=A0ABP9DLZ6_9BACT
MTTSDSHISYRMKKVREASLKYITQVKDHTYLETGITYLQGNVTIDYVSWGEIYKRSSGTLQLLSIPFFLNRTFGKYFYISGGPTFDFHLNDEFSKDYSGIGAVLGVGGMYRIKNLTFYLTPKVGKKALWRPDINKVERKLTELNIEFGFGYRLPSKQ